MPVSSETVYLILQHPPTGRYLVGYGLYGKSIKIKWAASWQYQQNDLCAQWTLLSTWGSIGTLATLWANSEDSDQTGRMSRLAWVWAGHIVILLVLSCGSSNYDIHEDMDHGKSTNLSSELIWGSPFTEYFMLNKKTKRHMIILLECKQNTDMRLSAFTEDNNLT